MIESRKIAFFAALFVFVSAVYAAAAAGGGIEPETICAEAAEDGPVFDSEGYDLGGYDLSIAFHNYMLSGSGLYRAFTVTVDRDLIKRPDAHDGDTARLSLVDDGGIDTALMFDYLSSLFKTAGYEVSVDEDAGRLTAEMRFDTLTDFYIAIGENGYKKPEFDANTSVENGFYFKKIKSVNDTIFSLSDSPESLPGKILEICRKSGGFTDDKIILNYLYGTPYKIVESDADAVTRDRDRQIYIHSFDIKLSEKNRKIVLTQKVPNSVGWYVTAAAAAVIISVVPAALCAASKKKKEEKKNGWYE